MNALAFAPTFAARVIREEPMSRHTSWHVGGPAELYFTPRDITDLETFLRGLPPDTPITWIGLGSNLLVRDGGIPGVVIATHGALTRLERLSQTVIHCDAGVPCAKIAKQCVQWGLGPAEFLAGIPGTLGGALAMNAGAFGGETWTHVTDVETIDRTGVHHLRSRDDYEVGYRHVEPLTPPAIEEWFLGAKLTFERRPQVHADDIRLLLERRKETQPIGAWSGGSTFVNPPGQHAAKLIEAAGLKGHRIGGASVSVKHANFILNEGEATAADIENLIYHVQDTVQRLYGVQLQTEVRIVGEPA
jgi:UDP-N-acetylmuramate dehydrogenase